MQTCPPLLTSQTEASQNPSQHYQTNTLDFADVDVSNCKLFPRVARSRDGVGGPQALSKQHLGFALGCVLGRRALSLFFRSVEWLLAHLQTIEAVPWTRTKSCVFHMKSPQSVTDWVAAMLDKAKFRVCVGVRSGPKGPVIVFSICGRVDPGPIANY